MTSPTPSSAQLRTAACREHAAVPQLRHESTVRSVVAPLTDPEGDRQSGPVRGDREAAELTRFAVRVRLAARGWWRLDWFRNTSAFGFRAFTRSCDAEAFDRRSYADLAFVALFVA